MGNQDGLRRQLSAGVMAMMAVGSSIGTGLFLGSGAAIGIAGPALIISYIIGGAITLVVTLALGELSALHPTAAAFGTAADIYLNPWAGFVTRYGYWIAIVLSVGAEMVAASTYMTYWFPAVSSAVWMLIFGVFVIAVNLFPAAGLGRFEFGFAMIKLVTIFVFILLGAALLFGGRTQPLYLTHGGFAPKGLIGIGLAVPFAMFSFLGVEILAASAGEASTKETIGRASWRTFILLAVAYLGATTVLTGIVPWNSTDTSKSPFVTVLEHAHVAVAPALMNFVVLTAALSGSVATLYACSRMLYSLAEAGMGPLMLLRLSRRGVPVTAVLVSAGGAVIAIILRLKLPSQAYLYIIGASLFGGMLAWCMALLAHAKMRRTVSSEVVAGLPVHVPGGGATSLAAFIAIVGFMLSTWFVPGFAIAIVSGPFYLGALTLLYVAFRTKIAAHRAQARDVEQSGCQEFDT